MNIEKEPEMAKKDVSDMISGLGMAVRLLTSLDGKITERKGNSAMLHFLTTPAGEKNLDQLADLIVSLQWRVPKSVVKELARKISIRENGDNYAISDEHCFWEPALMELNIPSVKFATENSGNGMEEDDEFLEKIKDQLEGKLLESGMILAWNDQPHVMSSIGYFKGEPMPGDLLRYDNIDFVHLTSIEYIDPEN